LPFLSSLCRLFCPETLRFGHSLLYLTNVCNFPELRHDRLLETPAVTCYASSPRAPLSL
jgi:hypothetical protein